ncbi:MAG: alcohol dehydrogenase catalytic domain-containing protein, partial [Pseudomonadota bacterium]|nr:alcohol dehydrogenase catalytic domain-containing protein [Pseudomonadota bacterium]
MQSMFSTEVGGPKTLKLTETETPEPKGTEVLIRVRAAGVNFPDTLMIRDMYQFKPERPFAPGGEIAGEIEAVG